MKKQLSLVMVYGAVVIGLGIADVALAGGVNGGTIGVDSGSELTLGISLKQKAADQMERAEKAIMQAEATSGLSQVMTTRGRLQADSAPPVGPPSSDSPLPGIEFPISSSNDKEGTASSSIAMSGSGSDDTGQPGVAVGGGFFDVWVEPAVRVSGQGLTDTTGRDRENGRAFSQGPTDTLGPCGNPDGIAYQDVTDTLNSNNPYGIARALLARARKALADGEYGEAFRLARSAEATVTPSTPRSSAVTGSGGVGPVAPGPGGGVVVVTSQNDPPIAFNPVPVTPIVRIPGDTEFLMAPKQLENLMNAYRNRRMDAFLGFFAPDFRGNRDELRRNAEKDWDLFHNIDISVMPMRVIPNKQNVEIEFEWRNSSLYRNGTAAERRGRSRIEFRPGAAIFDRWGIVAIEGDPFLGVGLDFAPKPRVISYSPRGGQSEIALDEAVVFDFSMDMDPGSLRHALTISPAIDLSYDVFGRRFSVKPQSGWRANTSYTVKLTSAATDMTGAPLEAATEFTFQTIGAVNDQGSAGQSPDAGSPTR